MSISTRSRTVAPASTCIPPATARRRSATTRGSSPRCGRTHRRRIPAAGFTLIEIVLVLVVLAVAGIIIAPTLQPTLAAIRGEAAARRTASFLDDVRRQAVLGRKVLRVSCRPDENRLAVVAAEGTSGREASMFQIPEAAAIVSCHPEEIRYYPQGYATGLKLILRDGRRQEYSVTVGTFTGLSRVEQTP